MARSIITNTSGKKRTFGFIPPHGRELDIGEAHTTDGDIRTLLGSGLNRYSRNRELEGLDTAIAEGDVTVEEITDPSSSSPAP